MSPKVSTKAKVTAAKERWQVKNDIQVCYVYRETGRKLSAMAALRGARVADVAKEIVDKAWEEHNE